MGSADPEKRKAERKGSNLFVEMNLVSFEKKLGRGVVVDVSLSGIAVETEADIESGAVLDLDIEVPLRLRARVIRRITPGQIKKYGLKFIGQNIFDKFLLKKILKGTLKTVKVR